MAMFLDLPKVSLPGPPGLPLLGNRINVFRYLNDPIATTLRLRERYGDLFALARDNPGWVCAIGPRYNKQILSDSAGFHNFVESPMRGPEGSPAGYFDINLVSQNDEVHRRNRRMMMSGFSKQHLRGYAERMVEVTRRRLETWPTRGELDVRAEMLDLSLEIAMSCLFGLDLHDGARELGDANKRFMEMVFSPGAILFQVRLPGTPYSAYLDTADHLDKLLRELIARRRAEGLGEDVFSALIGARSEEGESFNEAELIGQSSMLVAASHETTAATLAWAALMLATHPQIQDELVAELDEVLGGQPPTLDALERAPLLGWVIDETLRLLPPTPTLFFRRATADFELDGHAMPAGSTVLLSTVFTHRDDTLYPEPMRFVPRRWESLRVGTYEYLPFGAGARRCLGSGFAGQVLRVVIAMILQRSRFCVPAPLRVDYRMGAIIMNPRALRLHIVPREDQPAKPAPVSGGVRLMVEL